MKKSNNTFMAHKSSNESDDKIPSRPLDSYNDPHSSKHVSMHKQQEGPLLQELLSMDDVVAKELTARVDEETLLEEESSEQREKLKRHRVEVAGRVWIPDIWGQEELLKDWIDCTAFDAPLVPSKITMARAALVEQGTRTNVAAAALRIDNRC